MALPRARRVGLGVAEAGQVGRERTPAGVGRARANAGRATCTTTRDSRAPAARPGRPAGPPRGRRVRRRSSPAQGWRVVRDGRRRRPGVRTGARAPAGGPLLEVGHAGVASWPSIRPVIAATTSGRVGGRVGRAGGAQAHLGQAQLGGCQRATSSRSHGRRVPSSTSSVKATWRAGSASRSAASAAATRRAHSAASSSRGARSSTSRSSALDLLARRQQQRLPEQLLLGGEPVGRRGQRHAGALGDGAVGDRVGAALADQLERRAQDRARAEPRLFGTFVPLVGTNVPMAATMAAARSISYEDLYARWERGNWRATEIDFTEDARQWREEFTDFERKAALWNYALFFWGEDAVDRRPLALHRRRAARGAEVLPRHPAGRRGAPRRLLRALHARGRRRRRRTDAADGSRRSSRS